MSDRIYVLHVEDDADFAEVARKFLERESDVLSVESASNPSQGLDRLSSRQFDCIVSDYDMPGMNGIEFLEIVRDEEPRLPFILYTGKGSEEVASDAISAGVTDYLQKETGTEQYELLANRIANAVSRYRAEQQSAEQARILRILREVNQALLELRTPDALEQGVADTLSEIDPYHHATYWSYGDASDEIVASAMSGDGGGSAATGHPGGQAGAMLLDALGSGEVLVSQEREAIHGLDPRGRDETESRAVAVLPITYQAVPYGVYVLHTADADAIDESERGMLDEVAGDIGLAYHAARVRENLRHHQIAVEAAPEGLFLLDEEGYIDLVNEGAAALFDREPHEPIGKQFLEFVEDEFVSLDVINWYLQSLREMLSSANDRDEAIYETQITPPDGEPRIVEIHLALRPYEEEFRGTVGVIRDITDHMKRRAAIKNLHEIAVDMTGAITPDEVYLRTIEAAASLLEFGRARVAIEEEGVFRVKAMSDGFPEDEPPTLDIDEGTVGETYRIGESLLISDVSEVDAADARDEIGSAISIPIGERGVFQAIDERTDAFDEHDLELANLLVHHAESALTILDRERELERQIERLDEFANVLSHDLRNPLSVAEGRLEHASVECESDHLEGVNTALERMRSLIEHLLTLARLGQTATALEPISLRYLGESCWQGVATDGASLEIETDLVLHADEDRLRQLLENLFRNALEHGGGDVTVTLGELAEGNGFFVEDDGVGVGETERDVVFESGYTTDADGTGFGLAIVKQIARAHDWEISLVDREAGGARFEISGVELAD